MQQVKENWLDMGLWIRKQGGMTAELEVGVLGH